MLESAMRLRPTLLLPACLTLTLILPLTACDLLGDEAMASAKEAEGRAIGSGCRHTGRSLEECYKLNAKASKAAIFAGWRDMDGYMRENNIEIIPPSAEPAHPAGETSATNDANATHAAEGAPPAPSAPDTSANHAKPEAGKDKQSPAATPPNTASPSPASPPASKPPASPKPTPKPSH